MKSRRKSDEVKNSARKTIKVNNDNFTLFMKLAAENNSSASEVMDAFIKLYNSGILQHSQIVIKVNK